MRFFVTNPRSPDALSEVARHLKALRPRVGETFTLCDGNGTDFTCRVTALDNGAAQYEIVAESASLGEPPYALEIFAAFAKGERLEYTVQKCVELGASAFTLFPSENVVARPDAKSLPRKIERLQAIAQSAAEQCGRGIVPKVRTADTFEAAITRAATAELAIFAFEREKSRTLRQLVAEHQNARTISVVTGAEGGFTDVEADFAVASGLQSVTLGTRILRCDTAPIAIAGYIQLTVDN
ncbi:MAG: 16S rRNA (uracil(1498)-N(3))-methyltransferase [Oscillospiraceae bacterium]|jgi:16S rRNA (uracil1498-N3)-methyltransferase|nr:16S rRNA (uracil(1498)-N(3))-methyltransferase [Oscillospiraceae bacterium]